MNNDLFITINQLLSTLFILYALYIIFKYENRTLTSVDTILFAIYYILMAIFFKLKN